MENLTQTYGVVKPNVAPAPLEGYNVVVFEEVRGGTKYKKVLTPKDKPLKKKFVIISPQPDYNCFAVSSDTNLSFDFSTEMILANNYQHFILNCTIYYHVSNPESMAIIFKTDPINRIKDEIKKRIQNKILENKIKIEAIQDDFFGLKDKILPDATLNQIREFSREFGVMIKEINMTYKIPEKYLKPNLEKEEYHLQQQKTEFITGVEKQKKEEEEKEKLRLKYELKKIENEYEEEIAEGGKRKTQEEEKREMKHKIELRKIEYENEKEELNHKKELEDININIDEKRTKHTLAMEALKSLLEFRKETLKLPITAINNAIESINGAEALDRVSDAAIGIYKRVRTEFKDSDSGLNEKQLPSTANQMEAISGENTSIFTEAKTFLFNIINKVENSFIQPGERKTILYCITKLLAEIQLEEKANPEMIEKYTKELCDHSATNGEIFPRRVIEQIGGLKESLIKLINQATVIHDASKDSNDPKVEAPDS